jgi:eukaryotic-like serine/threonine-protein kinase
MDFTHQLGSALHGRYEVEREIGAGGMATVYLARDVKHNRRVALKVLRPELGAVLGVDRFLSEIQVTANLQHPNLLPLFDSGEMEGHLFYVMPYVEGESLRHRLDREKQLPIDVALHIATSVASALDYAHRQGVIHRDLKPENILLHEGEPLIADFGIALAVSNAGGDRVTQTGLSLGTPLYMSPEQATGDRAIDARSDVYSLGAVTYEMLTGEPPHAGSTSQAIIARLLTERPRPMRGVRPNVPENVERAVEHALEKLPADRFASAREFADALTGKAVVPLRTVQYAAVELLPPTSTPKRREKIVRAAVVGLAVVGLGWGAGATVLLSRPRDAEERTVRFEVPIEGPTNGVQFAVSPDGRRLVSFAEAGPGEESILWLRAFDEKSARPLPETAGAVHPFWSPDNLQIGYFNVPRRRLEILDVVTGTARGVADIDARAFNGGTWNEDGVILFSAAGVIYSVLSTGGTPTMVLDTVLSTTGRRFQDRFPVFLPDGRHFLYFRWSAALEERGIHAASLDGGESVEVMKAASKPAYAPPGYLLFNREGSLFAQEFDAKRLALHGEPILVEDGVAHNLANGAGAFSVSTQGVLAFRSGEIRNGGTRELQWFGRDGRTLGKAGEPGDYTHIRLSPDNRRIATSLTDPVTGIRNIWTLDLANDVQTRLTFGEIWEGDPTWFPDSRELVLDRGSSATDFYRKVLGSDVETRIPVAGTVKYLDDISSDGRWLLYHVMPTQLMAVPLAGGDPIVLGDAGFRKTHARFSPDGRWIVYSSLESGSWQIHVASFPAFDDRRQVSADGGVQAHWRADGRELFYLTLTGTVMSVDVTPGPAAEFSPPKILFESLLKQPVPNLRHFDVSSDGQRILLLLLRQAVDPMDPITVVVNWPRMLDAQKGNP